MPEPLSEPFYEGALGLRQELIVQAKGMTLEELRLVETTLRELIKVRRVQVARQMRSRGCSWTDVGRGLGISSQAAHKQFGPLCE